MWVPPTRACMQACVHACVRVYVHAFVQPCMRRSGHSSARLPFSLPVRQPDSPTVGSGLLQRIHTLAAAHPPLRTPALAPPTLIRLSLHTICSPNPVAFNACMRAHLLALAPICTRVHPCTCLSSRACTSEHEPAEALSTHAHKNTHLSLMGGPSIHPSTHSSINELHPPAIPPAHLPVRQPARASLHPFTHPATELG